MACHNPASRKSKKSEMKMSKTTPDSPKAEATAGGVKAPQRDMPEEKAKKAKATWTSNPNVSDPAPVPEDSGKK